jgi:drug/metabolite transporter (DMT)-like permease
VKAPRPGGLLPTLAISAAVLFWGLSFASSKAILNTGFPPMTMVCLRFFIASAVLVPLQLRLRVQGEAPARRDLPLLLASGLFGVTFYFFFEARGIRLTSAANASLIVAAVPVLTLAADRLLFRASLSVAQGLGIALSVAGVFLIVRRGSGQLPHALAGDLFMGGACLCWVAYILVSRRVQRRVRGLRLTTWQAVVGAVTLVPLALLERRQWVAPGPVVWLNLLYLGLACSALSYFLYLYALEGLEAVVASTYINLVPVIGVAGGVLLLGERLVLGQALGGAVVILGVFLAGKRRARGRPREAAR